MRTWYRVYAQQFDLEDSASQRVFLAKFSIEDDAYAYADQTRKQNPTWHVEISEVET
jgi:hypothetical protein